jgi:hypothetical protein
MFGCGAVSVKNNMLFSGKMTICLQSSPVVTEILTFFEVFCVRCVHRLGMNGPESPLGTAI